MHVLHILIINDWPNTCGLTKKVVTKKGLMTSCNIWFIRSLSGLNEQISSFKKNVSNYIDLNFTFWTHEWTLFMNILHVCDIPPVKVSHRCLQLCGQPLVSDNPSRNNSRICTLSPDCCVCLFSPGNEDKSLLSEGNFHFR